MTEGIDKQGNDIVKPSLNIRQVKTIELQDWDAFVSEAYGGRPYKFQQQAGCQNRGNFYLTVPNEHDESEMANSVPEIVNGEEMGVKLSSWLARDPKTKLKDQEYDFTLILWWERNFYPHIQAVANDLHKRGLLEAGEYVIDIDW